MSKRNEELTKESRMRWWKKKCKNIKKNNET
jgi:hypothetical protein